MALKYSDVFVPGGFPKHTYNPRKDLSLENKLADVKNNLCKLVAVTGHTKTGKTVLVRQVLPKEECIWVDGGSVSEEDDFWSIVIDQLNLFTDIGTDETKTATAEASASVKGGMQIGIVGASGEAGTKMAGSLGSTTSARRAITPRATALKGLAQQGIGLVIDDFHYLPKALQGNLIRALKPLIFDGLPVVIIAIPHRRYDAMKVEREMTGRIEQVTIPSWTDTELHYIARTGFPLLNFHLDEQYIEECARESIGSPHLMQEFCRAIGRYAQSTGTSSPTVEIPRATFDSIFEDTADSIGRPIFEKLARGPRQRSDRISRMLKTGGTVDIYGLVLHALAQLKPGLVTLQYEDLRTAIKEVSLNDTPQFHEVTRVLKHMSDIAATDESSVPVIDFDEIEKQLHVTDPFFAFYLRYGNLEA